MFFESTRFREISTKSARKSMKFSEISTNSARFGKKLANYLTVFKQRIDLRERIPKRCKGKRRPDIIGLFNVYSRDFFFAG